MLTFRILIAYAVLQLTAFAQTLTIASGNGQVTVENFPTTKPLTARLVNSAGAGVPDVPITWAVTQSEGALASQTNRTDANGYATVIFVGTFVPPPQSYRTSLVTATTSFGKVDFVVTTTARQQQGFEIAGIELFAPTGEITGRTGQVIPAAVGVRVYNLSGLDTGKGIPFVGVSIAPPDDPSQPFATCRGPNNQAFTDQRGEANCDLVLGDKPGRVLMRANVGEFKLSPLFQVNIEQGPICTFAITPTSASFTASGGSGALTVNVAQGCSWTATTTAPWITIASGGSGQASGTVSFVVAANTGAARTGVINIASQSITITQAGVGGGTGPISFVSTSPLPAATVGITYTNQLQIAGGTAPYNWSATGTFPPGLGLNPTNGFVSGVPTTAGTFAFTLTVFDVNGATVSQAFTMTVNPQGTPGQLTITTASLPNGGVGSTYQQSVSSSGACSSNPFSGGVVTWALASGALPPGLNGAQAGSDFAISGVPTTPGTYNFSLRVSDTCGRSDTKAFSIVITQAPSQTATLVATPGNVAFSVAFTAASSPDQQVSLSSTNANLPVTYTASTSTPWLSITNATGTTPGSITVRAVNIGAFSPGNYTGSITFTSNAVNSPLTLPVTLTVASASNITVSRESILFSHTTTAPISQQNVTVSGAVTGIRYTASASTNNGGAWLTVTPTSGETQSVISVTANSSNLEVGTYTGVIRVVPEQNAGGTVLIPVTLTVSLPSTIIIPTTPLTFNGPGTQTIPLTSTSTPISFSASGSVPWLTVTPTTGSTPSNLSVTASTTGLSPGVYQGAVSINSTGQTTLIPVTLTVTSNVPTITSITNGASFAVGPVAPGEIITLFGTSLGPMELKNGDFINNSLQTTVGGTQVFFDNVAAPIIYSASNQVAAIVPFGVFGRTSTKVQLVYNNQRSNTIDAQVTDAAPGIFVLDVSGQGAILNQDNSVNSRLNGAAPGSVIAIYATGAGTMDRQVIDGRLVTDTPFPRPLLPVGVRIGGRVADVLYAGAAPGLVAGTLQVNARIPVDTPANSVVPIQITVGTATSQANVVVAIR